MIHRKKWYTGAEEFQAMPSQQLRGHLAMFRRQPGRDEAIIEFQAAAACNPNLTWITEENFDRYYVDDVDVVIDELARRAGGQ